MAETTAKKTKISPDEELVRLCEEIAYDRKAENIVRLNLKEYSAVSDYFLLCTAVSEPHVGALAERIRREVQEKTGIKPLRIDGSSESHWMIVDFGNVMIHIMTADMRDEYQLETLWDNVPALHAEKRIEARIRKKLADARKTSDAATAKKTAAKKPAAKKTAAKKPAVKKTAAAKKPAAKKTAAAKKTKKSAE